MALNLPEAAEDAAGPNSSAAYGTKETEKDCATVFSQSLSTNYINPVPKEKDRKEEAEAEVPSTPQPFPN